MARISIIGLGLIGTSMGLGLKKANLKDVEIVGHDREPEAASKARKRGALDKVEWNLFKTIEGASIVILAIPVQAVKEVLTTIGPALPINCLVTDTASTKAMVMQWAGEILPETVNFVGGHPMAGKEASGPEAADADLFRGSTYCVVPSPRASREAVQTVMSIADLLGAKPFFVDAVEHDGFVAAISHLPIVLSSALVSSTMGSASWREMGRLASSGFRDVSRLASGDPVMHRDICVTNRESILRWIDIYIEELKRYKELITGDEKALEGEYARVRDARDRWIYRPKDADYEGYMPEIPSARESLTSMFLGRRFARLDSPSKDDKGHGKSKK